MQYVVCPTAYEFRYKFMHEHREFHNIDTVTLTSPIALL